MQPLKVREALILGSLVFASGVHAQDIHHKIAVAGAVAGGYQYQNGIFCNAPVDLLNAFKEKMAAKFEIAGVDFEAAFAEGREDASQWRKQMLTKGKDFSVGEADLRKSMCVDGHLVEHMREKLNKR